MFFSNTWWTQLLVPLEILMSKISLKYIPIHIHNFEHSRVIMNMKLSSHGFLFHINIKSKAQIPLISHHNEKKQRIYFWWAAKVKVTWHTAKYGDPYSELVLCIYPSKVHTHSSAHTHTVNTHPEQWAAIYAVAPREQLGVRCLAQEHLSRGGESPESSQKEEKALVIRSPHLDSNSQSLDYESDSLTIRPRLPQNNWASQISEVALRKELEQWKFPFPPSGQ